MTAPIDYWRLSENVASLACGSLRASLQVDEPAAGLHLVHFDGVNQSAVRVLQWLPLHGGQSSALRFHESYVRGSDLVATYLADSREQVQPQVYWRALENAGWSSAGVELIVSVQTSLLDSQPESSVISELAPGEVWHLLEPATGAFSYIALDEQPIELTREDAGAGVVVIRPSDEQYSYAEMIHPTDFHSLVLQLQLTATPRLTITSRLFPERLEKGVIRRSRICGWFLPRDYDLQLAAELYHRFVNEPPPLTT